MRFAVPRSFFAPSQPDYWFPAPVSRLPVLQVRPTGLSLDAVPRFTCAKRVILPQTFRLFRALLSCTRPTPPGVKPLPWGWHSLFAVPAGRICVRRLPHRLTFPSLTFLTPPTVSASTSLVGLFHPTTTSRVLPTGVCLLQHSRADSSSSRALTSVSQSPLPAVAHKRHVP